MAKKILTPYGNLTANEILAKATAGLCTLAVNGANLEASDVKTTAIRNFFGLSSNKVSVLCKAPTANKWSGFSPFRWSIVNQVVQSSVRTPYDLGAYCGYNHNASQPSVDAGTTSYNLGSSLANSVWNKTITVNLGEVNWIAELGYQYCVVYVNSARVTSLDLNTYKANTYQNISFDVTLPAQGGDATYNIEIWFGSTGSGYGKLPFMTASFSMHIKVAPAFANMLCEDTATDRSNILGALNLDPATYYCSRLEPIVASKSISVGGTSVTATYYVTAQIKRVSNNTQYSNNPIPHRITHVTPYMYKVVAGTPSAHYSLGSQWLDYSAGGVSQTWTIPQALLPINDDESYYVIFKNFTGY